MQSASLLPSMVGVAGLLVLLAASAAYATHPGTSARIAYNTTCQDPSSLTMIWPDGSGKTAAAVAGIEPAWSADGSRVAYVRTSKIYVAAADGSDEQLLVPAGTDPTWSPDGKTIAFTCVHPGAFTDICSVDVATGAVTNLTDDSVFSAAITRLSYAPTWSPDAAQPRIAFYRVVSTDDHYTGGIWSMAPSGTGLVPLAVADGTHDEVAGYEYASPDWAPDGTRLGVYRRERVDPELPASPDNVLRYIATIAADGTDLRHVTPGQTGQDLEENPAWSPDGTSIAFLSGDDLWVAGADGMNPHLVTSGACNFPAWEVVHEQLVVNSTEDRVDKTPGDGQCDTGEETASGDPECTLRAAIEEANVKPGKDTIAFDIPDFGSHQDTIVISRRQELEITDPVVIDGTTQPGGGKVWVAWSSFCNITDGTWPSGLVIRAGDSTVRGLAISGFCGYGIVLTEGGGNVLEGNFIGTDATGMIAVGNGYVIYNGPLGGGVLVQSGNNRIGGTDHDVGVCNRACNVISSNARVASTVFPSKGLVLSGSAAGNTVYGNFIGSDVTGQRPPSLLYHYGAEPQEIGIVIEIGAHDNTIGGTTAGMRNLIAANTTVQIFVDAASEENSIAGNFIGTDASGTGYSISDQANGILIHSGHNQVTGNVIGGFTTHGVSINGNDAAANVVSGNLIGIGSDGITELWNGDGVRIEDGASDTAVSANSVAFARGTGVFVTPGATNTTIAGNTLHHNEVGVAFADAIGGTLSGNAIHDNEVGVSLDLSSGVRISANAIHDNVSTQRSGLGIDLAPEGVTLNDFGDVDAGPNGLQNFPTLGFAAVKGNGGLRIGGSLDTTLGSHLYRIELFANAACDPSGYGEGERFLGFVDVATDFAGRAVIDATLASAGVSSGQFVTTTATDPNGYTSELSRCVEAQPGTDLADRALIGATTLAVTDDGGLAVGDRVAICPGCPTEELNVVAGLGSIVLVHPLQLDHEAGEPVVKIATTLDPFVGYTVATTKGAPKPVALGPVTLGDRFGTADYDVVKLAPLEAPAGVNGGGTLDAATHLLGYAIKAAKGTAPFQKRRDVRVVTPCADTFVQVKRPASLLVPTAESPTDPVTAPDASAHQRDHFLCYPAKAERKHRDGTVVPKPPPGMQVDVADQFQTRRYDLKAITRLCQPVAKSGAPSMLKGPSAGTPVPLAPAPIRHPDDVLVCYQAKLATRTIAQNGCVPASPTDKGVKIVPKQASHTPRRGLHAANQLGTVRLDTKKAVEICLPSTSPDPGVPVN